ncbi:MAG: hypothetical protein LBT40_07200 [Deltaproteobacteria bacterium]|jgi:hypothetical protein|nr:hypothetical protein [Deltaproteobacteria bacterium]
MADLSADNTAAPDVTASTEGGNTVQSVRQILLSLPEAERADILESLHGPVRKSKAAGSRRAPNASGKSKSRGSRYSRNQDPITLIALFSVTVALLVLIFTGLKTDISSLSSRVDNQFARVDSQFAIVNSDIRSMSDKIADMRVDIGRLLTVANLPRSADATRERLQPPDVPPDAGPPGHIATPNPGPAEPVAR